MSNRVLRLLRKARAAAIATMMLVGGCELADCPLSAYNELTGALVIAEAYCGTSPGQPASCVSDVVDNLCTEANGNPGGCDEGICAIDQQAFEQCVLRTRAGGVVPQECFAFWFPNSLSGLEDKDHGRGRGPGRGHAFGYGRSNVTMMR